MFILELRTSNYFPRYCEQLCEVVISFFPSLPADLRCGNFFLPVFASRFAMWQFLSSRFCQQICDVAISLFPSLRGARAPRQSSKNSGFSCWIVSLLHGSQRREERNSSLQVRGGSITLYLTVCQGDFYEFSCFAKYAY